LVAGFIVVGVFGSAVVFGFAEAGFAVALGVAGAFGSAARANVAMQQNAQATVNLRNRSCIILFPSVIYDAQLTTNESIGNSTASGKILAAPAGANNWTAEFRRLSQRLDNDARKDRRQARASANMLRGRPLNARIPRGHSSDIGVELLEKLALEEQVRLNDNVRVSSLTGQAAIGRRLQHVWIARLRHGDERRFRASNRRKCGAERRKTVHRGRSVGIEAAAANEHEQRFTIGVVRRRLPSEGLAEPRSGKRDNGGPATEDIGLAHLDRPARGMLADGRRDRRRNVAPRVASGEQQERHDDEAARASGERRSNRGIDRRLGQFQETRKERHRIEQRRSLPRKIEKFIVAGGVARAVADE
jgi:hypothetical protein